MSNNLHFFTGEDTYRLQELVKGWKNAFLEKHGDLNLSILSIEDHTIPEMISQIETAPFLGDKRLIFLEGLPESASTGKKRDAGITPEQEEALLKVVQSLPETSIVVLVQPNPDKRKSLYKKLVQLATVKSFESLKGAGLSNWVQRQSSKYNGKIDAATALHLVSYAGEDLWKLDREIEKMATYAGDQSIPRDTIEELVIPTNEANLFRLTDALSVKNTNAALKELNRLQVAGESMHQVLYMLARQIRILIQIKETSDPSSLKLHPFVLRNASSQAKNFTTDALKKAHADLVAIDVAVKTGAIKTTTDDESELALAMERFMISLKT
ncbi:DNA polymerase III subunit delta [Candidatus Peregrinibacteria bacterium]|nr:MAG: DNA polymerase III subunit delta [Candidatus Peregrinibacteria bacterium]